MVTGLLAPAFERTLRPAEGHTLDLGGLQSALNPLIYGVGVAIVLSFFLRETGRNARQEGDRSRTGALVLEESGS